MEIGIYQETELLPFQKVNNFNRWQFPLILASDEKLLPFTSYKRPSPRQGVVKSFSLCKVEVNDEGDVIVISNNAITALDELNKYSGTTRDYYYYYAAKDIWTLISGWALSNLTRGLYQYKFTIEPVKAGIYPDKKYKSNIFCYDPLAVTLGSDFNSDFYIGDF